MTLFAAATHQGRIRSHNEDCYEADPDLGLWLVADGVGGHANGEVAAAIVRDTITAQLRQGCSLVEAVRRSHRAVLDEIRQRAVASNMGSTVVALVIRGDNYEIAWVGDSRAYLFDGNLRALTRDHSPVADLLASGVISVAEAAQHPERHVLSQSLGVSEAVAVAPGHISGRLRAGQQILLCSDGLTDELNDQAIVARLRGASEPRQQVDDLLDAALEAGGHDNITVVLIGAQTEDSAEPAAAERGDSHDGKVLLILAIMVAAALTWLVLRK